MTDPHDHNHQAGQVFVADPADADYFDEPELPKWPKVVGIISIVFASLGLVCGGVGAAWMFVQPGMMQSMAQQLEGGVPPQLLQVDPMLTAAIVVGLLWALFLLVCGVMCISRKHVVRPLFLAYAVGAVVLTLWTTSIQLAVQDGIAEWIRNNPDADFANQPGVSGQGQSIGQLVGLIVGLAFSLSWPTFCLVWFGLVKRKPDDFTGGANIEVI